MSKTEHEVYTIRKIKDEAKDVKTFVFDRMINSWPGEFVMAWLPGVSENPFSVSHDMPLGITVKKVGDETSFTSKLFELKVNDKLWIRGPYGIGFPDIPFSDIYLVAGGSGAIPLAYFSSSRSSFVRPPTVLLGAKTKDEIIFEKRFRKSSKKLLVSTDDGSYGYKGLVTDLFKETEIKPNSLFYICGPEKMMKIAAEKAMQYTDADDIFLSLERYMKCGCGRCGSCEINGYRTCADGPVFRYSEIRGGDFGMYSRTKSGTKVKL
jgi:dihydroorotate dehydrogenase electron transfer subunit